jgi:hypothetical protein
MIDSGEISVDNQIFINTKRYFIDLYQKIYSKNKMIRDYLYNKDYLELNNEEENEMKKFMEEYLNMYGFMFMKSNFLNNILKYDADEINSEKKNLAQIKNKFGGIKITKKRNIKNKNKKQIKRTKKNKKTKKNRKNRKQKTNKTKK